MLKKGLLVAAGLLAISQAALALEGSAVIDPTLPELPRASDLSSRDVGQQYILKSEHSSEQVIFAGYSYEGTPVAFSATDAPAVRQTFQDAVAYCLAKGPGWRLPSLNQLRIFSPVSRLADPQFLPGSYWTTTLAPCANCKDPTQYKMAYDISTGNVRNGFALYFTKFYTACTYPIP